MPFTHAKSKPQLTASQKALGLLSRREHSEKELAQKLTRGGYAREEAQDALARMQELDFQNDERFAEVLVRSRMAQGYGPRRIEMELATHGLTREAIRETIDAQSPDWNELARDLIRRRTGGKTIASAKDKQKLAELLIRRGFSGDSIRNAMKHITLKTPPDSEWEMSELESDTLNPVD